MATSSFLTDLIRASDKTDPDFLLEAQPESHDDIPPATSAEPAVENIALVVSDGAVDEGPSRRTQRTVSDANST